MPSKATTVQEYLAELPADRRAAIATVRDVFLKNLDKGYQEGMQYGMIGYCVPHSIYPAGYHCDPKQPLPFAGLASHKSGMSLYLFGFYTSTGSNSLVDWFQRAWAQAGKKLDMGKSCVRFKKVDDLALDVLAEALRRLPVKTFIEHYETAIAGHRSSRPSKPAKAAKRAAKKKTAKAAPKRPAKTGARKVAKKR